MKQCTKCKKKTNNFAPRKRSRDGLASWCRDCKKEAEKIRRLNNIEKVKESNRKCIEKVKNESMQTKESYRKNKYPLGLKKCPTCLIDKPFNLYGNHKRHKDGLRSSCKSCEASKRNGIYATSYKLLTELKYSLTENELINEIKKVYIKNGLKRCPTCGELKHVHDFGDEARTLDGHCFQCKSCRSEASSLWSFNNKEKRRAITKRYRDINPHYKENRVKVDINYRITEALRSRYAQWFKNSNYKKSTTMKNMLGYEIEKAREHLKYLGYQQGYHHIDHIVPLSRFDITKINHVKVAYNYMNLQPLTPQENIAKSNKLLPGWESIIKAISLSLKIDHKPIISHIIATIDNKPN